MTINDCTSYVTIDETDEYLSMKYGSTWLEQDTVTKEQLLITATRYIDSRRYIGRKVDDEQELEFPRVFKDKTVSSDKLIQTVVFEIADYLNSRNMSATDITAMNALESYQVGDTKVTFKDDIVEGVNGIINDRLRPYLADKGMQIWL